VVGRPIHPTLIKSVLFFGWWPQISTLCNREFGFFFFVVVQFLFKVGYFILFLNIFFLREGGEGVDHFLRFSFWLMEFFNSGEYRVEYLSTYTHSAHTLIWKREGHRTRPRPFGIRPKNKIKTRKIDQTKIFLS
jgi:hypothetical protein